MESDPGVEALYERAKADADRQQVEKIYGGKKRPRNLIYRLFAIFAFLGLIFATGPSFFLQIYIRDYGVATTGEIVSTWGHKGDYLDIRFKDRQGHIEKETYEVSPVERWRVASSLRKTGQPIPVEVTYLADHPWLCVVKGIPCWNILAFILAALTGICVPLVLILLLSGNLRRPSTPTGLRYYRRADFPSNEPDASGGQGKPDRL